LQDMDYTLQANSKSIAQAAIPAHLPVFIKKC